MLSDTLIIRSFFFFNDTATTEIYTLSLHDALPISSVCRASFCARFTKSWPNVDMNWSGVLGRSPSCEIGSRSEEHTSELQSRQYLVCRLLLEKKKTQLITSL